jgi:hypothetical protein
MFSRSVESNFKGIEGGSGLQSIGHDGVQFTKEVPGLGGNDYGCVVIINDGRRIFVLGEKIRPLGVYLFLEPSKLFG